MAAIGFGLAIKQSHHAEQLARIEAQRAHREAILNLREARDATDTWLVELSGSLQFYPGMSTLRSELLDRAIAQLEHVEVHLRLGELERINALIGELLVSNQPATAMPSRDRITTTRRWLEQIVLSVELGTHTNDHQTLDAFASRVASVFV